MTSSSSTQANIANGRLVHAFHSKGQYDVYIGRQNVMLGFEASKWANPYKISPTMTREAAIASYRAYILSRPALIADLPELKGKVLGCWCAPLPCHGDVLLELVGHLERADRLRIVRGSRPWRICGPEDPDGDVWLSDDCDQPAGSGAPASVKAAFRFTERMPRPVAQIVLKSLNERVAQANATNSVQVGEK